MVLRPSIGWNVYDDRHTPLSLLNETAPMIPVIDDISDNIFFRLPLVYPMV